VTLTMRAPHAVPSRLPRMTRVCVYGSELVADRAYTAA
jgi:hypothetical protein